MIPLDSAGTSVFHEPDFFAVSALIVVSVIRYSWSSRMLEG
jgi:hypothetical protein